MLWGLQPGGGCHEAYSNLSHCARDAIALAYDAHGQASSLRVIQPGGLQFLRLWQEVSPCNMCVMRQAGPLRTHLLDSIVWMSMLLRACMSLSQHPIGMSETFLCLCTHTTQPWWSRHFLCGDVCILVPISV